MIKGFSAIVTVGKLAVNAGWYQDEIPVFMELVLLQVWPSSGVTLFNIKIVQLCFGVHWNLSI